MDEQIKLRIKSYLTAKGLTVNKISKDTGYPQSNLQKQINEQVTLSVRTLMVIINYSPDMSAEWLLRGEGCMCKEKHNVINVVKQGGNGEGQTNILGDGNETSDSYAISVLMDELKHLREQNNKLLEKIMNG